MSYFLPGLLLAVLPALAQPVQVAPVIIYTQYQKKPSTVVADSIRKEVEAILSPMGLPLGWKQLEGARGDDVAIDLAVVHFLGNCGIEDLLTPVPYLPKTLGITHVTDGTVIPFTDINCDSVRDFLRKDLIRAFPKYREALYGRAVGRVLAHELFHIFTGTTHHGLGGVAAPTFTESDLMADRFQFETRELRTLRASLKQARRENSRSRAAPSPLAGRSIFQEYGCAGCHGLSGEGTPSAPAIRASGKSRDPKTMAANLAKAFTGMYAHARKRRGPAPVLDEEEMADLLSFLSALD